MGSSELFGPLTPMVHRAMNDCNYHKIENHETAPQPCRINSSDSSAHRSIAGFITYIFIASVVSNLWLRVKGPDKQIQNDFARMLSVIYKVAIDFASWPRCTTERICRPGLFGPTSHSMHTPGSSTRNVLEGSICNIV